MYDPGPDQRVSDKKIISVIQSDNRPFSTAGYVANSVGLSESMVRERLRCLEESGRLRSANATPDEKIYWVSLESS